MSPSSDSCQQGERSPLRARGSVAPCCLRAGSPGESKDALHHVQGLRGQDVASPTPEWHTPAHLHQPPTRTRLLSPAGLTGMHRHLGSPLCFTQGMSLTNLPCGLQIRARSPTVPLPVRESTEPPFWRTGGAARSVRDAAQQGAQSKAEKAWQGPETKQPGVRGRAQSLGNPTRAKCPNPTCELVQEGWILTTPWLSSWHSTSAPNSVFWDIVGGWTK